MITIVFAHPWHGSFNKAILDTLTTKLDKENKEYQVIDLNKDNFNPVLTEEELSLFGRGGSSDPLVDKYKMMVASSDELVFIFPIWWHTMPAILKGFFDKVLLFGFAYNYENGWTPLLHINKASIITTSQGPTEMFRSSIEGEMIPNMLSAVGINNATWMNCDEAAHGDPTKREELLRKVNTLA